MPEWERNRYIIKPKTQNKLSLSHGIPEGETGFLDIGKSKSFENLEVAPRLEPCSAGIFYYMPNLFITVLPPQIP